MSYTVTEVYEIPTLVFTVDMEKHKNDGRYITEVIKDIIKHGASHEHITIHDISSKFPMYMSFVDFVIKYGSRKDIGIFSEFIKEELKKISSMVDKLAAEL